MFSALFSFLGGSVFRALWGEAATAFNKYQDHKHEMEALRLQADLDDKRHQHEIEKMKVASEIGLKTLEVKTDAEIEAKDAEAFIEAMKTVNVKTGNKWVDAWNGSIRPAAATTALLLWWFCLYMNGFILTDWDKELVGVIIGFFFAHRVYVNRSK